MSRVLLSGKIKCMRCKDSNYKSKIERNVRKYICTNYSKGLCSPRIAVIEDDIVQLIENRYGKLSEEEIRNKVDHIDIYDKWVVDGQTCYKLTIHFVDDEPITLAENDKLWKF